MRECVCHTLGALVIKKTTMVATHQVLQQIRPVYKKLVRLAKTLPEEQRGKTLDKIRHEFRVHREIKDANEISELLVRAQSSIGYLKIVTPRDSANKGVKKYIYRNGERVEATSSGSEEGARYKTVDMEAVYQRHHKLLRRQHFMDRGVAPPKPIF